MVVLGIDGLTSPICSNVVTLLANERDPDEFSMASATAVCKPAQNSSGDLNAAAQSIDEWDEPGAVGDLSYGLFKQKNFFLTLFPANCCSWLY